MTDLDALARRIARDVAELSDRTSPEDDPDQMGVTHEELIAIVVPALHEAHAAGRAEGFAEGAEAMRRDATLAVEKCWLDEEPSYPAVHRAIADLPLPTIGEKP